MNHQAKTTILAVIAFLIALAFSWKMNTTVDIVFKVNWVGPMPACSYFNGEPVPGGLLRKTEMGLREDGVVVWRKRKD